MPQRFRSSRTIPALSPISGIPFQIFSMEAKSFAF
jgi:hypothetical protein